MAHSGDVPFQFLPFFPVDRRSRLRVRGVAQIPEQRTVKNSILAAGCASVIPIDGVHKLYKGRYLPDLSKVRLIVNAPTVDT